MNRPLVGVVVLVVALAGCSEPETSGPTTTAGGATTSLDPAPTTTFITTEPGETQPPQSGLELRGELLVPEVLNGFEIGPIWLDGEQLMVGIADTSPLRQHGLMFVDDLGDLDGMIFIFEQDSSGGFWMKNTLLPLDIAFFDGEGRFVDGFAMEPCVTDTCPSYRPRGEYRYALEMMQGDMPDSPQLLTLAER